MKKRILVADDDTAILDVIQIVLEDAGYDVDVVTNGKKVLASSKKESILPDLVLLDIWMAGEDGREICRVLRSQQHTKDLPIILISASRDVKQSAFDAGADDFIAKPFEMEELLIKVAEKVGTPYL